jgi:hypothetical protein
MAYGYAHHHARMMHHHKMALHHARMAHKCKK